MHGTIRAELDRGYFLYNEMLQKTTYRKTYRLVPYHPEHDNKQDDLTAQ